MGAKHGAVSKKGRQGRLLAKSLFALLLNPGCLVWVEPCLGAPTDKAEEQRALQGNARQGEEARPPQPIRDFISFILLGRLFSIEHTPHHHPTPQDPQLAS